ncbi:MAG: sensor histidine kinase [Bryobacteraceae bacterium]|nr:sensor histidine kinase [Bryobacteraceae bacterium]
MARDSSDGSAFRSHHTTIPYLWRRYIGIIRVILGGVAIALYALQPTGLSLLIVPIIAACTIWSGYVAIRKPTWSVENAVLQLVLDLAVFTLCATHGGESASWLAITSYFYLLLVTSLLYEWQVVLAIVAGTCVFSLILQPPAGTWFWPAFLLGGVLATILAIQQRSIEERLSAALRRSVLSRSEAELAREQERQRIAADFHDGPLQSFISFQMRLELIRKLMSRDGELAMTELVQLQDLGRSQLTELRTFVRGMQPSEVNPNTLSAAIREAIEHFERDSGIGTDLYCGDLSQLHESLALDVLQIVREGLNNARKHSKASRVILEMDAAPDALNMRIEDDGSGFPFSGAYSLDEMEILRLGPRSIKRRVRTLGGEMILESRPTGGSTLKIRIPVVR